MIALIRTMRVLSGHDGQILYEALNAEGKAFVVARPHVIKIQGASCVFTSPWMHSPLLAIRAVFRGMLLLRPSAHLRRTLNHCYGDHSQGAADPQKRQAERLGSALGPPVVSGGGFRRRLSHRGPLQE